MRIRTLSARLLPLGRPLLWVAAAALVIGLPAGAADAAPPQIPGVQLIEAWPDVEFQEPIHVTHGGDGSDWLYVCEQPGVVKRIKKYRGVGDVPQPSVFLDLRQKVYARSQGGLLCMACHPQFKTNRLFYVSYLAQNPRPGPDGRKFKLVIEEYRSAGAEASPNGRIVIEIPKKTAQHQAGGIGFGPDGMLYIGIGDGNESKNDAKKIAQNARYLLGKILRIDPMGRWGNRGYSIPDGNPWWPAVKGVRPEIWGYGFRNPWRFCWDKSGIMWVTEPGSTGPESREWVTQVVYGGNHGWPYLEGNRSLNPLPPGKKIVPRSFEYVRGTGGATAGIGGYIYRGDRCKQLKGRYILGDYMRGEVYALELARTGKRIVGRKFGKIGDVPDLASFGEDEQGEIYMCSNGDLGVIFTMAPDP